MSNFKDQNYWRALSYIASFGSSVMNLDKTESSVGNPTRISAGDAMKAWEDQIEYKRALTRLARVWWAVRMGCNHGCSRIKDEVEIARLKTLPSADLRHILFFYPFKSSTIEFGMACEKFLAAVKKLGEKIGRPDVKIVRDGGIIYVIAEYACWELFPKGSIEHKVPTVWDPEIWIPDTVAVAGLEWMGCKTAADVRIVHGKIKEVVSNGKRAKFNITINGLKYSVGVVSYSLGYTFLISPRLEGRVVISADNAAAAVALISDGRITEKMIYSILSLVMDKTPSTIFAEIVDLKKVIFYDDKTMVTFEIPNDD